VDSLNEIIELEHVVNKKMGRPSQNLLPPGLRLLPRRERRRLARKFGYGRVPAVLTTVQRNGIIEDLEAELLRRAAIRAEVKHGTN